MIDFKTKGRPQVKSRNKIGLDIGAYAVKVIEISETTDRPALVRLGAKNIIGLSEEAVSASLKSLADEAGLSSREVNISISGPSVIVRFITLPKMGEDALGNAVRFEAEKFIPFNIDDCVLDFQVLKPPPPDKSDQAAPAVKGKEDPGGRIKVLLVAAKKDVIEKKISLVEQSGMTVRVIDVDSFALTNAFSRNFPAPDPNKTIALLNIGAASTNVSILRGDTVSFVRETAMGGNDLTAAIVKNLGLDEKAAEALKLSGEKTRADISSCTKSVLGNLLEDIKLSFNYHENQNGSGIDEIYISGGGSLSMGVDELFQDAFGSRPQRWNPFGFIDISQAAVEAGAIEKMKDSLAVAIGLALR